MKRSIISQILHLALISVIFSLIVYFGFVSNYTKNVFNKNSFIKQYNSSIYKYRIISTKLLTVIDEWVEENIENATLINKNNARFGLDDNFSDHFYLAYFIQNTFFLLLTTILFVFIFNNSLINISEKEKLLIQCIIIFLIAITQYTVVPYDNISYFFFALFILSTLNYYKAESKFRFFILSIILFVATFNRESSALFISFFATFQILKYGKTLKSILPILYLIIIFLIAYLILRFIIVPTNVEATYYLHIKENLFEWYNLLGISFWIILSYLVYKLCNEPINKKSLYLFILLSSPYVLFCFVFGVMFETRLFIPIFLISIVISQFNIQKIIHKVNL